MTGALGTCEECLCLTTRDRYCWTCTALLDGLCVECGAPTGLPEGEHRVFRRCGSCRQEQAYDGPVYGWRAWAVVGDRVESLTPFGTTAWESATMTAPECPELAPTRGRSSLSRLGPLTVVGRHEAPAAGCGCGYRLMASLADLLPYWTESGWVQAFTSPCAAGVAFGRVRGDGIAFRGRTDDPRGTWRVQRLTIVGPLYVSPTDRLIERRVRAMTKRYGKVVEPRSTDRDAWLREMFRLAAETSDERPPRMRARPLPSQPLSRGAAVTMRWLTPQLATGGVGRVAPRTVIARAKAENVDLVIDCRSELEAPTDPAPWDSSGVGYLRLPTQDSGYPLLAEHFDRAVEAARPVLAAGGRVFVHCNYGINRGPSTAYAVLRDQGVSAEDAEAATRAPREPGSATLSTTPAWYVRDAERAHQTRDQRPAPTGPPRRIAHTHAGTAGAGVAVVYEDQVLLTKRSLHVADSMTWGLPGGLVDRGEDARTAAFRELLEETNVPADGLVITDAHEAACPDCPFTFTTFIALAADPPKARRKDKYEVERVAWRHLDDVAGIRNLEPGLERAWPDLLTLIRQRTTPC